MLQFTYTFEREIKEGKTLKNVTDAVRNSLMERELEDTILADNIIIGKDRLFKLDFSSKSPLIFSPGKEFFNYNENTRILTYKIEALYPILSSLIYSTVLFLILHFLVQHQVIEIVIASLFFFINIIMNYCHYLSVMDKISKSLNEN
ncbi:hypothetical protein [Chryseobacterium sp. IT-36CA2]|uniref:hypothetical protein n=1 Tax=Chryseobacterium sp. IT-36CA2 TaxID=3026460 RepID=UPI0039DF5D94